MITVGVDLAAEPKRTAVARIEWSANGACLASLELGATDARIVAIMQGADKTGIDCPFGWPDDFVRFVTANSLGERHSRDLGEGMEWRRRLAYRETDRWVHATTGRWPLSVSTDKLGLTAMRCAALLDEISASGIRVDRTGRGPVAEVYPAATLRAWGFSTTGYKADIATRRALRQALQDAAPWLDIGDHASLMDASDDAFGAVIACLAARAAALDLWTPPPADQQERASREGWIVLPRGSLEDLR